MPPKLQLPSPRIFRPSYGPDDYKLLIHLFFRARHHHSGLVVVKVFTKGDSGLNLKHYHEKLVEIKKVLEGCVNCMPFNQAFVTDRAGFIVRQYVKDSLYDRISTRPFLTLIEKKWIAFQLLLALQQAHKHGE